MSGITLQQIDQHMRILHVACSRCDRRGRYRISGLIARYGRTQTLPALATMLASDCRNADTFAAQRCNLYFPGLKTAP